MGSPETSGFWRGLGQSPRKGLFMTLQQLKYVVEVAERGSITEAAKALFIAQPSLSAAVRELEEEAGITIFLRNSRGILLTQEGVEFLGYARQVVQQAALIEEKYIAHSASLSPSPRSIILSRPARSSNWCARRAANPMNLSSAKAKPMIRSWMCAISAAKWA